MHEYSIISSLVERVEREARARSALAIRRVRIKVGEQSGVDPELLATAYAAFRDGTVCSGAPLELERVPVRWACRPCGVDVPAGSVLRCPRCGGPASLVEGGEITLEQIELEVP